MKRQVKYRILTITGKMTVDLKLVYDDARNGRFNRTGETVSSSNGDTYINLTFFPMINFNIVRKGEVDENGVYQRPPLNLSDMMQATRYQLPLVVSELKKIYDALCIPEMYSYLNSRLEVNDELAEKHRRVSKVGMTVLELTPVVIVQPEDESRIEGVKMKFNNEQNTVLFTLNDIETLIYTMEHFDIDATSLLIQNNYLKNSDIVPSDVGGYAAQPVVDIKPKIEGADNL